ncbi:MAG: rRNA maturation RNase YbeY [Thermodesulfovibrio sp. RBG_19FT_COMBO_41_18]|nr:MAG: rRNA maturation RNase YbeY [Thermodesulfovibrio sp. RBG_19FT_COMBO_41_18]
MKVYIKNQQRLIKVNHQRIRSLLKKTLRLLGLHKAELSILFVNDRRMRILNRQYRGVDKTTDVLSFPQIEYSSQLSALSSQQFVLGDIIINLHQAKRQASQYGLTFNEELKKLLIHGLLHLIDYDHEKSRYHKVKMRAKEKELLDFKR